MSPRLPFLLVVALSAHDGFLSKEFGSSVLNATAMSSTPIDYYQPESTVLTPSHLHDGCAPLSLSDMMVSVRQYALNQMDYITSGFTCEGPAMRHAVA